MAEATGIHTEVDVRVHTDNTANASVETVRPPLIQRLYDNLAVVPALEPHPSPTTPEELFAFSVEEEKVKKEAGMLQNTRVVMAIMEAWKHKLEHVTVAKAEYYKSPEFQ